MNKGLVVAVALVVSGAASAAEVYVGIDYSKLATELNANAIDLSTGRLFNLQAESEPTAINLKFGYLFGDYLATEFLLGGGISAGDIKRRKVASEENKQNTGVEFELDKIMSLAVKAGFPVFGFVKVYGKLGYCKITFEHSIGFSAHSDGLLYGVGGILDITQQFGVNLEYVIYPDGEFEDLAIDVEATALNLGVNYTF